MKIFDYIGKLIIRYGSAFSEIFYLPKLRREFHNLKLANYAMQKLLDDFEFEKVLDIGSGAGLHSNHFLRYGKAVTAIDFGQSLSFKENVAGLEVLIGDFNYFCFLEEFDCVWCSHVLEHQLDVQSFLENAFSVLKEGGVLCVTVPPMKDEIVGGHVSLWNAGLLLYRLVLSGFDCREASILTYRYNISVIVRKRSIAFPDDLSFDSGDIEKLISYFPDFVREPFNGKIRKFNW